MNKWSVKNKNLLSDLPQDEQKKSITIRLEFLQGNLPVYTRLVSWWIIEVSNFS